MKFTYIMAGLLIIRASLAMGQSDVSVSKKEFKTDKPGFDAAWQYIKDGDSFYSKGGVWYTSAMNKYKVAYGYNNKNPELNYKLGASCLYSDKREQASEYLLKALKQKPAVADDILLLTGRALQYSGNFKEAGEKLNEYLSSPVKKSPEEVSRANRYFKECKSAMVILKDSLSIEIRNLGANINSSDDEYSEVISRDGEKIYFASRRAITANEKNYYIDTKFDEDIYRSDFENGNWSVSTPAGKNLRTEFCETPLDIDPEGKILYIYAGYEGNGDIKVSEFKNGEWRSLKPESFGITSSEPETSFSMSTAGNEIAFVSDRGKMGIGGKDIYFISRKGKKWSKPVNAGANINSDKNEESVRFSRGGDTLWFSSAGHNSTGGFDIFYSTRSTGSVWSPAVNAGSPINTQWDELFYFPSPLNGSQFYFVSNRSGGFGGLDIYSGRVLPKAVSKPVVTVDSLKVKTDSIPKLTVKTDSIPQVIIQKPDSVSVTDTSAVKKTIIK
jgi:hypothetical protein